MTGIITKDVSTTANATATTTAVAPPGLVVLMEEGGGEEKSGGSEVVEAEQTTTNNRTCGAYPYRGRTMFTRRSNQNQQQNHLHNRTGPLVPTRHQHQSPSSAGGGSMSSSGGGTNGSGDHAVGVVAAATFNKNSKLHASSVEKGDNEEQQQQRARSLSAGRTRLFRNDVIQDVYERLGVKRSDFPVVDNKNNINNNNKNNRLMSRHQNRESSIVLPDASSNKNPALHSQNTDDTINVRGEINNTMHLSNNNSKIGSSPSNDNSAVGVAMTAGSTTRTQTSNRDLITSQGGGGGQQRGGGRVTTPVRVPELSESRSFPERRAERSPNVSPIPITNRGRIEAANPAAMGAAADMECIGDEQRRSKSVTRGFRSAGNNVTKRWLSPNIQRNNNAMSPQRRSGITSVPTTRTLQSSPAQRGTTNHQAELSDVTTGLDVLGVKHDVFDGSIPPTWSDEKMEVGIPVASTKVHEERVDQEMEAKTVIPPSVKECISAYGGAKSKGKIKSFKLPFTRTVDPQYMVQFATREHKPKIDIYAEQKQKRQDESNQTASSSGSDSDNNLKENNCINLGTPADDFGPAGPQQISNLKVKSPNPSNPTATEIANFDGSRHRVGSSTPGKNTNISSGHGKTSAVNMQVMTTLGDTSPAPSPSTLLPGVKRGGKTSNMANAFLAAINQPSKVPQTASAPPVPVVPVTEIATPISGSDANSVAISSVSAEEFLTTRAVAAATATAPKEIHNCGKWSAWNERNRVQAYNSGVSNVPYSHHAAAKVAGNNHYSNNNTNIRGVVTDDDIEKIIEERVQAQVSVLEAKMEAQMMGLMQEMEDKIISRIQGLAG